MCISTAAFALFLSILPPAIVEPENTRVIVHATQGTVHWVARGDEWCTMAPQFDNRARAAAD